MGAYPRDPPPERPHDSQVRTTIAGVGRDKAGARDALQDSVCASRFSAERDGEVDSGPGESREGSHKHQTGH